MDEPLIDEVYNYGIKMQYVEKLDFYKSGEVKQDRFHEFEYGTGFLVVYDPGKHSNSKTFAMYGKLLRYIHASAYIIPKLKQFQGKYNEVYSLQFTANCKIQLEVTNSSLIIAKHDKMFQFEAVMIMYLQGQTIERLAYVSLDRLSSVLSRVGGHVKWSEEQFRAVIIGCVLGGCSETRPSGWLASQSQLQQRNVTLRSVK